MIDEATVPPHRDRDDGPISVLLVDDNEQWARFIASDLEDHDPSLTVHIALSPNEAMLRLGELDIDCVVADYQMPEVDGLQLLGRLREDHPELPYILATSEGSEDVASAAIDAGVSDYVVKDPRVDQLTVFASKIRRAVESARLRQAMAESERRYRSLTEQSSDAILIVQNDRVVFANQRLSDLTGQSRSWFASTDNLTTVVHPEDRDDVRTVIGRWAESLDGGQIHELRLQTVDSEVRHCEFTGRGISYNGEPAVMLSIRDVTERKQQQRELRWEQNLNRAVQSVLVTATTSGEIERELVALLVDHGYELAWIGVPENGTLTPQAQCGATDYLTRVDYSMESGTADSEPSLWAARSGEPRFVTDFEELFPTDWREQALTCGYRSAAAVPLSHNDISYGVLAVYHADADRFDETERRLLGELADNVAFAIHTVDTEQALASDHSVEVTLRVADDTYYLVAAANEIGILDADNVSVRGTIPHTDGQQIQYLSVAEEVADKLQAFVAEHPTVIEVATIREGSETRLQVVTDGPLPEARLVESSGVVRSTVITANGAEIVVDLPARDGVRRTVDRLEAAFDDVSVLSVTDADRAEADTDEQRPVDMGQLTTKQAAALEAAFHHGYFKQPRGSSATEIAAALGVAHSTFLQHLRAAQQKVFVDLHR